MAATQIVKVELRPSKFAGYVRVMPFTATHAVISHTVAADAVQAHPVVVQAQADGVAVVDLTGTALDNRESES